MEQPGLFILSYNRKGDTEIGYLFNFSEETLLFSTNIHGNIKFDKDGVYSNFSNFIEIDKNIVGSDIEHYVVNFRKRDQRISTITESLRELEEKIKQFNVQNFSIEEKINPSYLENGKRSINALDEINEESLHEKLRIVEEEVNTFFCKGNDVEQIQQDFHNIKQTAFNMRLDILKNKLVETLIGESIVCIIDKYYYKVANLNTKNKIKTFYYYPAKKIDVSQSLYK